MKDLKLIAASALDALTAAGADQAAVTARYTETREFNVDGGEFSLFRTLFDNSLSLTAFKAGKKGSLAVNHFDEESIAAAAADCLAAAEAGESDPDWELAPCQGRHEFADGRPEPEMDKLFDRCIELMEDIGRCHPSILMEQMIVRHEKINEVYANTLGSVFSEKSGFYNLNMMFSAHEGDKGSSFFGCDFTTAELDKPFIEMGSIRRDLGDVEKQIHTRPVEGKFEGTVLLTPGCLKELLYYALAAFADGSVIYDGTSLWKDKLGKAVADERLTVSLAPNSDLAVTGAHWTGDGCLSEDFNIIEKGVLNSFLLNKYFANKTGFRPSPNTSIRNMIVAPGDKPLEEIVAGIGRGLVVSRVSGGNPGASGDFSMVAKNSFLIENGKIGDAVSEVMVNGNLAELLNNIRHISCETERDGYGSLPWIAFDGVTVAGK